MICYALVYLLIYGFENKSLLPFDMYNTFMRFGQSVFQYSLNSPKRVTHSTIKVLHQPTSSECVTTFSCSLPRACPNENKCKLQKFAMGGGGLG